jgi:nucleotide-binding universal stress UspA family protein
MKRILVALDSSPRAIDVLVTAVALARSTGGKLRLLRAVGLPPELPTNVWAMPQSQILETFLASAKRELELLAREVPPEYFEGATAQVGVAWDAICSYGREHDVDLIVVGAQGYSILDRIMGTTAAKVVNHADRPVLVVRPKGKRSSHEAAAE